MAITSGTGIPDQGKNIFTEIYRIRMTGIESDRG
jgi:hypothetical protein